MKRSGKGEFLGRQTRLRGRRRRSPKARLRRATDEMASSLPLPNPRDSSLGGLGSGWFDPLMSPTSRLAFQAGQDVFAFPARRNRKGASRSCRRRRACRARARRQARCPRTIGLPPKTLNVSALQGRSSASAAGVLRLRDVLGREENAARVMLNWALSASGREPATCGGTAEAVPSKHETIWSSLSLRYQHD